VFTWTPLVDPYPDDQLTGYVILRDTLDFTQFNSGSIRDGAIVTVGQKIGSATVIAIQSTKLGSNYTDQSNLLCGYNYTYRVYGFRFTADQKMSLNQTFDSTARGRQYNENYAQSISISKPILNTPTITVSRTSVCPGDTVTLKATADTADNYEWMRDGVVIQVAGTTQIVVRDQGTYKLRISSVGGCFAESAPIEVTFLPSPIVDISPQGIQKLCPGDTITLSTTIQASGYEWLRDGVIITGATSKAYRASQPGIYQVRAASQQGCPGISGYVTIQLTDVRFHFEPATVVFDTISQCETSAFGLVEIVNDGAEPITIGKARFPSGFALASPSLGFIVQPGGRQTLRLLISPTAPGATSGNAEFTAQPCSVTQSISLFGTRTQVIASINKAGIDFGVYTACPNSDIRPDSSFILVNSGTSTITIKAPLVKPPFYMLTQFQSVDILPNTSFEIKIQYRPLGPDLDKGVSDEITFPFKSDVCDDTLRASLQAAAYQPRFTLATSTLDFGSVLGCEGTVDTIVNVTNVTNVDVVVAGSLFGNVQLPDTPITIPPFATHGVAIRVTPVAFGSFTISDSLLSGLCEFRVPITVTGSIIEPEYTVSTPALDMGQVRFCTADSTTSTTFMMKASDTGTLGSLISSVSISPPFTLSLSAGQILLDSLACTVTYSPTIQGFDTDTAFIVVGPCSDTVTIALQGEAKTGGLRYSSITSTDFGTIGPAQSSQQSIMITNVGDDSIVLDTLDGVVSPFRIETSNPLLPSTLLAGDSAVITIAYDYLDASRADTVEVVSRTSGICSDTVRFKLTGFTNPADTVVTGITIIIPTDLVAQVGEDVDIPLALLAPNSIAFAGVTSGSIDLRYDATILKPFTVREVVAGISGTVTEVSPGYATLAIDAAQPIDAADPLLIIVAKTYLGSVTQTPIKIDSINLLGIEADGRDGMVTVVNDCSIKTQVISLGITPSIQSRYSSENLILEFATLTDDRTEISIVDIFGNRLLYQDIKVRPGIHELTIPTNTLPAGSYYISMTHGRFHKSTTQHIVR
jgi:hypothetical protein